MRLRCWLVSRGLWNFVPCANNPRYPNPMNLTPSEEYVPDFGKNWETFGNWRHFKTHSNHRWTESFTNGLAPAQTSSFVRHSLNLIHAPTPSRCCANFDDQVNTVWTTYGKQGRHLAAARREALRQGKSPRDCRPIHILLHW